jgi:hypothetical protein
VLFKIKALLISFSFLAFVYSAVEKPMQRVSWCDDLVALELQALRDEAFGKKNAVGDIGRRLAMSSLDDSVLTEISITYKKILKATYETRSMLQRPFHDVGFSLLESMLVELLSLTSQVRVLIDELRIRLREQPCALTQLLIDVLFDAVERLNEQRLQLEGRLTRDV